MQKYITASIFSGNHNLEIYKLVEKLDSQVSRSMGAECAELAVRSRHRKVIGA